MPERHYCRPTVEELTGLSRSTIYSLMDRGDYPRPIKLSARIVAWPESRIDTWVAQRASRQL
ncbi:helix-turn-helix transcriptional regulator [Roseivivax sp. CAU 1761]